MKHQSNNKVYINLPILFDATCNGTQHLAAIVKDPVLGRYINLIEGNKRGDYYEVCAKIIENKLVQFTNNNTISLILNDVLLNINITRNMIKKPVITTNYNITL